MRIEKDVKIAETTTMVYVTRKIDPTKVNVFRVKSEVSCAAFPAKFTGDVLKVLKKAYPQFVAIGNVLECGLNNWNHMFHPPTMLLNAPLVKFEETYSYEVTPEIARVIEVMDMERIAILRGLGLEAISFQDEYHKCYPDTVPKGKPVYETLRDGRPRVPIVLNWELKRDPLHSRFVIEPVPYGLVPIASIGDLLKAPTPTIKMMIQLASVINQIDYWRDGRTAEKLGLAGLSRDEIVKYVTE
jgi:opine dehydrogenase